MEVAAQRVEVAMEIQVMGLGQPLEGVFSI